MKISLTVFLNPGIGNVIASDAVRAVSYLHTYTAEILHVRV